MGKPWETMGKAWENHGEMNSIGYNGDIMGIEWNSGGDILEDGVDLPCGNLQELWSVTIF